MVVLAVSPIVRLPEYNILNGSNRVTRVNINQSSKYTANLCGFLTCTFINRGDH